MHECCRDGAGEQQSDRGQGDGTCDGYDCTGVGSSLIVKAGLMLPLVTMCIPTGSLVEGDACGHNVREGCRSGTGGRQSYRSPGDGTCDGWISAGVGLLFISSRMWSMLLSVTRCITTSSGWPIEGDASVVAMAAVGAV